MKDVEKITEGIEPFLRFQHHRDEAQKHRDEEVSRLYAKIEKSIEDQTITNKGISEALTQLTVSITEQTVNTAKNEERWIETIKMIEKGHTETKERADKMEATAKEQYYEQREEIKEIEGKFNSLDKEVSSLLKSSEKLSKVGMVLIGAAITGVVSQYFISNNAIEKLVSVVEKREVQAKK